LFKKFPEKLLCKNKNDLKLNKIIKWIKETQRIINYL